MNFGFKCPGVFAIPRSQHLGPVAKHRSLRLSDIDPMVVDGKTIGTRPVWYSSGIPSGYVKIAIENSHTNSEFPIKHGDFP